jgi:hypothetical protein
MKSRLNGSDRLFALKLKREHNVSVLCKTP